jgi:hypothetical protein
MQNDLQDTARRLRSEGHTLAAIAAQLGVSPTTAHKWAGASRSSKLLHRATKMLDAGLTLKHVAASLGLSKTTILNAQCRGELPRSKARQALICLVCGTTFEWHVRSKNARGACFRPACVRALHLRRKKEYRETHREQCAASAKRRSQNRPRPTAIPREPRIKPCAECGAEFSAHRATKYCSDTCRASVLDRQRLASKQRHLAARKQLYREDAEFRMRQLEKAREYGQRNRDKVVAKSRRNKLLARARDPQRYRELARKHANDSKQRAQSRLGREDWALMIWKRRVRKRYGFEPSADMWELLAEQRQVTIDFMERVKQCHLPPV